MEEIWKEIDILDGYEVSNLGRVRNAKTGVVRKQRITMFGGYFTVVIQGNSYFVHRLVAKAFVDNPLNLPYVNHKDESRTNNIADNLEWCTQGYNVQYGTAETRRRETYDRNLENNSLVKKVAQCNMDGSIVKVWPSMRMAARAIGHPHDGISLCCNGKREISYGYKWKFV